MKTSEKRFGRSRTAPLCSVSPELPPALLWSRCATRHYHPLFLSGSLASLSLCLWFSFSLIFLFAHSLTIRPCKDKVSWVDCIPTHTTLQSRGQPPVGAFGLRTRPWYLRSDIYIYMSNNARSCLLLLPFAILVTLMDSLPPSLSVSVCLSVFLLVMSTRLLPPGRNIIVIIIYYYSTFLLFLTCCYDCWN